jgi:hypothetical protein
MQSEVGPLPTFLIIGAQKCATRWLRLNLGAHPEVFTAPRELEYFNSDQYDTLHLESYRSQFDGWTGERIVGEATPGYMFWRHHPATVAARIHDVVPDVRLVAILRNPVDRARSALIHHIENRALPRDTMLIDYTRRTPPEDDPLGIITGGWYAASLEPFARRFESRLLIVLHDDVHDDARKVYETVARHVGAAPDFVPPELERVRFSNQKQPDADKRRHALSKRDRRELQRYFADDIARLETTTGRDLSIWDREERY